MKTTTRITAVPCGRDRDGHPLKPRTFVVDERREDWGDNRTRVFVRRPDLDARPGQQCFAPEVVRTDSIQEASPAPDTITDVGVPQFLFGKQPGHNIDRVDIAAGLRRLEQLGWNPKTDARTFMVIEHALQRWGRGEEAAGERLAIAQGETDPEFRAAAIDLTSWRAVLATAIASAEAAAAGTNDRKNAL